MIRALVALLSLAFLPLPALAGTTGTVSGFTRNWNGDAIAHTRVTIGSRAYRSSTTSDEHGFFVFVGVPSGTYVLGLEQVGYAPIRISAIVVGADTSQRLFPQLRQALIDVAVGARKPTVTERELPLDAAMTIVSPQTFPLNDVQPFAQQLLLVPGVVGP